MRRDLSDALEEINRLRGRLPNTLWFLDLVAESPLVPQVMRDEAVVRARSLRELSP